MIDQQLLGMAAKRKRVVLTVQQKLEVIKMLDNSISYTIICEKFGIGRSTVSDIKSNREKLLKFNMELKEMGTKRDVKVMKLGDDPLLDKAVNVWFRQKEWKGFLFPVHYCVRRLWTST